MATRHLRIRTITWTYMIVDLAVTLGLLIAAGLWTNNAALLSLIEPPAVSLSSWLLTLVYPQLIIFILFGIARARILSRGPFQMS